MSTDTKGRGRRCQRGVYAVPFDDGCAVLGEGGSVVKIDERPFRVGIASDSARAFVVLRCDHTKLWERLEKRCVPANHALIMETG